MVWRIGGVSVKRAFRLAKLAWKIYILCFVTLSFSTNRSFYSLKNNTIFLIYSVANRYDCLFLKIEKRDQEYSIMNFFVHTLFHIQPRIYSTLCSFDKKEMAYIIYIIFSRMIRGSLSPLMDRYKINFVSGKWHLLQQ